MNSRKGREGHNKVGEKIEKGLREADSEHEKANDKPETGLEQAETELNLIGCLKIRLWVKSLGT